MKQPRVFLTTILIVCLGLAAVLWFYQSSGRAKTSARSVDQARTSHSANISAASPEDSIEGKPRTRDATGNEAGLKVVRLMPDQVLATVNKEPIQLRHLMPVATETDENILTPEEYDSRLQRAIDIEVVLQAAQAAGIELTEPQQKRRDAVGAGNQAELAHYQTYGLTWSTAGPEQVEFEKRLLSARMLEQNMVAKASALNPSPDPAIQARYELARLDLLKELYASADVVIAEP